MAFNGSGVHNRVHDWTQDLTNTIPVTASRMDAEHDDISASLSNTICRDGQSTTTARIPFASGTAAAGGSTASVAYGHQNDPNTGLYFPGADQWGLAAGGTAVMTGTSSGVSVTGTHSVSGNVSVGGDASVGGNATVSGTLAATGDITHHGQPIVPIGTVIDFAGASAPNGWLLCFGQAVSRTTYSALFGVVGTIYGVGDGSTTFNLPDLRGRVVAGQDDMGGTSANRLTNQNGGLDGDTLGAVGGAETHTLTEAQMPQHTHTVNDNGHRHQTIANVSGNGNNLDVNRTAAVSQLGDGDNNYVLRTDGTSVEPTISRSSLEMTGIILNASGSGTAHNNVQPTIILNKIVFTGIYS